MSIPPLVCSTPPPPDQCEDEKEDDFDIQYRLSQEEDEESDSYNYGTISTYNDYCQENKENLKDIRLESQNISNKINDSPNFEDNSNIIEEINVNKNDKSPKYEDVAIEDLNLKIEEETIISESILTENYDNADDTYGISCIVDHLDSPDKTINISNSHDDGDSSDEKSQSETNISPAANIEIQEESSVNVADILEDKQMENTPIKQSSELTNIEDEIEKLDTEIAVTNSVDDFDDFENFKFTTTTITQDTLPNIENPWNSNDTEEFGFGDFKANFESNNIGSTGEDQQTPETVFHDDKVNIDNSIDDDDFGDFDDFKSSVQPDQETQSTVERQISHHVPVLNLQCPDNEAQIIESINNILFNIFSEEIPEDGDIKPERDLESMLTEVWHHLKLVDERQPYIIQWNNSFGQKSLLKALCIDSRNILFGPKWNYMTPKYAPNLSAAPLQPQKSSAAIANTSSSDVNSDKTTNKENSSWSDPFSSDGQEYTYAEALLLDLENLMATLDQMAHKHSTLKISDLLSSASNVEKDTAPKVIRSSDLDVFENAISVSSIDNIHSSTLSVQPLRHINLPDTHIFTPTDSETPRSKTIHYDNGPPILLPQQIIESHTVGHDQVGSSHIETENNEDYWEFQDFKGIPDKDSISITNVESLKPADEGISSENISNPLSNSSVTYQTQVLEPVKLEPIMPKLNWPDPGEVKETFDDFSDFISKTNWSNGNEDTKVQHLPTAKLVNDKPNDGTIEDEFETFQSAAPSVHNHINQDANISSFEKTFQSQTTLSMTNNILPTHTNNSSPIQNNNSKTTSTTPLNTHPLNATCMLQPINSVNTTRSPQVGQILQPLSLESYSQINWPKPGIDLQNLTSFNPLESLQLFKSDSGSSGPSKVASPVHIKTSTAQNDVADDDIWGDFVSSKPKDHAPKKTPIFAHDDEWTDFVSSPSLSQNSLNTISFNVQTNSGIQKNLNVNSATKSNQNISLDIPTLNYITPKSSNRGTYIDKHFQNL